MDKQTVALIAAKRPRCSKPRLSVVTQILRMDQRLLASCEIAKELAASVDTQSSSQRVLTPHMDEVSQ